MDMEDPSEEKMLTNLLRDPEEALRTEPQFPHMLNQQPAAGKNSEQEVQLIEFYQKVWTGIFST